MTKEELIQETIKIFRSRDKSVFPDLILHDNMDDYTFLYSMRTILNTSELYHRISLSKHEDTKEIIEGIMLKYRGKE